LAAFTALAMADDMAVLAVSSVGVTVGGPLNRGGRGDPRRL